MVTAEYLNRVYKTWSKGHNLSFSKAFDVTLGKLKQVYRSIQLGLKWSTQQYTARLHLYEQSGADEFKYQIL